MTNSLISNVMEAAYSTSVIPEAGMGATILLWTDRHAATIVDVSADLKRIGIQRDIAIRKDKSGIGDVQTYDYRPDHDSPVRWFTKRKDGKYREEGYNHPVLALGVRDEYYDYSF